MVNMFNNLFKLFKSLYDFSVYFCDTFTQYVVLNNKTLSVTSFGPLGTAMYRIPTNTRPCQLAMRECGEQYTTNHMVDTCPLTKSEVFAIIPQSNWLETTVTTAVGKNKIIFLLGHN